MTSYRIERELISPATKVIFAYNKRTAQRICLKMWIPCNNGLYDTEDMEKCTNFQLEGLEFNRRFAPGIYLGMTRVLSEKKQQIRCGPLIRRPTKKKLRLDRQHGLVMKRLDDHWRLDYQLYQGGLSTKNGMEFLAREIARIHGQLPKSPKDQGRPDAILSKLTLNVELFDHALHKLHSDRGVEAERYGWISTLMKDAYKKLIRYFEKRYTDGHTKRCHGDLKVTNMWVCPATNAQHQRLLALDCVDFKREFYHIDTLSDIAMLAIDIEAHLANHKAKSIVEQTGQEPIRYFLETYLEEISEKSTELTWTLQEYYMTEKAMVCAYMSILYDKLPQFDRRYLDIALIHAQRLEGLLGLLA